MSNSFPFFLGGEKEGPAVFRITRYYMATKGPPIIINYYSKTLDFVVLCFDYSEQLVSYYLALLNRDYEHNLLRIEDFTIMAKDKTNAK